MECHLIPPFILRDAGLLVNDTPKIQSPEPDEDTHVIFDPETKMRIHLGLNGIFSYFNCRSIAADEMKNWRKYKVVESTPLGMRWDPYNPVYQEEEEAMLDGRGKILDKTPDRNDRFNLIEKDDWDQEMESQSCYCDSMSVHEYEGMIAKNFTDVSAMLGSDDVVDARFLDVMDDELKRGVSTIDSCLIEDELADAMESLEMKTAYGIAAGSMSADVTGDDLFHDSLEASINAAAATFSTIASNPKGVSADQLSKIWRISQEEAELTLQQTTQLGRFSAAVSAAARSSSASRSPSTSRPTIQRSCSRAGSRGSAASVASAKGAASVALGRAARTASTACSRLRPARALASPTSSNGSPTGGCNSSIRG